MRVSRDKIPVRHLIQLQRFLAHIGISAGRFLQASNIDPEEIAEVDTISLPSYLDAVKAALELAPRPDLGFQVGKHTGLLGSGMLGYALLSCATLKDSLNRYQRYQAFLAPGLSIDLIQEGEKSRLTTRPALPNISRDRDLLNYLTGQWLASWDDWPSIWGTPAGFFDRVHLGHSVASRASTYARLLGCPAGVAGDSTAGIIASQRLDHRPHCDQRVFRLLGNERVSHFMGCDRPNSEIVFRQLVLTPGHTPSMEEMAITLLTSVRTLRRRLQREGTTYQKLVLDFRQYIGEQYLNSTCLPVYEIARLVGFADTANFYRLFRDTKGLTPQSFRHFSWERRSA